MSDEIKVTSEIEKSLTLTGNVAVKGQPVLNMNCSLKENGVTNIQTYVTNQELFLSNSQLVAAEVQKFRASATEESKKLNCFVF
ncbi:hypothetical protein [Clostridium sardiniense]|uniref:hypothetical protein n=1 Tax=Clostridium sardiniense TaxID=29369 RepID=UPI003D350B17